MGKFNLKLKKSEEFLPLPFFWKDAGIFDSTDEAISFIREKYGSLYKKIIWYKTRAGSQLTTYEDLPEWGYHETMSVNVPSALGGNKVTMQSWRAYELGLIPKSYIHVKIMRVREKSNAK